MSTATLPKLLTLKQLCALLGLSRKTVQRLRRRGAFPPPVRLSEGRIAWREPTLAAWLAEREEPSGQLGTE